MPIQKRFAVYELTPKRTRTIGVILHRLDSPFITSALRGIEKVAAECDYGILITHSQGRPENEDANARLLFHRRVDGVLASPAADTGSQEHFAGLIAREIPVVYFGRAEQIHGAGTVIVDNKRCGYLATEHLVRQGCTRILLITSTLDRISNVLQYAGFLEALKNYRVAPYGEPLFAENLWTEAAQDVARKVLRMDPLPDGLFITDDRTAAVCMHALKEAGIRVPEDIAIVGSDNHPVGRLITPALTTIDYPGFEIGRTAASALLRRLSASTTAGRRTSAVIPPTLIVRGSSVRSQHHWKTH